MAGKAHEDAVEAERQRIRLLLLGCEICGEIHEFRKPECTCGTSSPTWAHPGDGHAYSPRCNPRGAQGVRERVTALLDGEPGD